MSVFTHHPFYAAHNNDFGNFGSLVRFIDDWDKTIRPQVGRNGQVQSRQGRRIVQTFTPRFDVRETEQNYELHGELPGVEKKDVEIEFSDPQTIVIRGNVERTYAAGNPPAGLLGDTTTGGAITNEPHNDDNAETRSNKSFQATVEDEKEEGEAESNTVTNTTAAETPKPENSSEAEQQKHKYWVYERSVGSFSRSFTFSSRVDHENVSASLDNGILTVIVPKAKKHESRRIDIH
ncbi:30 kDa heat shock protein [Ustulina deusta]|nr:30 kDa heat shock protein [Ustulina deusta]KAI3329858.1 30 kDa heat shock protein [Ustulina deusta]